VNEWFSILTEFAFFKCEEVVFLVELGLPAWLRLEVGVTLVEVLFYEELIYVAIYPLLTLVLYW
jgi:hypothetical protein